MKHVKIDRNSKEFKAFVDEEVEFPDVPKDYKAKSTNTHISTKGLTATKTVTKTYKVGGTIETRKAEITRSFEPIAKVDVVA